MAIPFQARAEFPVFPVEPGISSFFPAQWRLAEKTISRINPLAVNSRSTPNREFAPA
jgi:hypothetical protein